jgi:hypothetical protein
MPPPCRPKLGHQKTNKNSNLRKSNFFCFAPPPFFVALPRKACDTEFVNRATKTKGGAKVKNRNKKTREKMAIGAVQGLLAEGLLVQDILAGVIAVVSKMEAPQHANVDDYLRSAGLLDEATRHLNQAAVKFVLLSKNEDMLAWWAEVQNEKI